MVKLTDLYQSSECFMSEEIQEKLRPRVVDLLKKNISKNADILVGSDVDSIVTNIEMGIFEYSGGDEEKYKKCYRKVSSNISTTSNARMVISRILSNEWEASRLAYMTHEELYPELNEKDIKERMDEDKVIDYFKKLKIKNAGGLIVCGKCNSNKVTYIQIQQRSADEPMSLKCTCEMCGKRWTMS